MRRCVFLRQIKDLGNGSAAISGAVVALLAEGAVDADIQCHHVGVTLECQCC